MMDAQRKWLDFLSEVDKLAVDFEQETKDQGREYVAIELKVSVPDDNPFGPGWYVCDAFGPTDGPYDKYDCRVIADKQNRENQIA